MIQEPLDHKHQQDTVNAVAEAIRTWRRQHLSRNVTGMTLANLANEAGVKEEFAKFQGCPTCLGQLRQLVQDVIPIMTANTSQG